MPRRLSPAQKAKKSAKKYAKKRELNFDDYPMTGNRKKELKLFREVGKSMDGRKRKVKKSKSKRKVKKSKSKRKVKKSKSKRRSRN